MTKLVSREIIVRDLTARFAWSCLRTRHKDFYAVEQLVSDILPSDIKIGRVAYIEQGIDQRILFAIFKAVSRQFPTSLRVVQQA